MDAARWAEAQRWVIYGPVGSTLAEPACLVRGASLCPLLRRETLAAAELAAATLAAVVLAAAAASR